MYSRLIFFILAILMPIGASAQLRVEDKAEFDSPVHDFGDICLSDGPQSHTFTMKNISTEDITILNVASSCGCTSVKWSRESIPPGGTGFVSATYKNDSGPVPFNKTLTVYLSCSRKPVLLRLKGVVYEEKQSVGKTYPYHYGDFALRTNIIRMGNMTQGIRKSTSVMVANIGNDPLRLSFCSASEDLTLSAREKSLAPGETTLVTATISPSRDSLGYCTYYFKPVVNGSTEMLRITGVNPEDSSTPSSTLVSEADPRLAEGSQLVGVTAFIKPDFSSWSSDQIASAAMPRFKESTFSFPVTKQGGRVSATYTVENTGHSPLHIHRIQPSSSAISVPSIPDVAPGSQRSFAVDLDTSACSRGEVLFTLTLMTNSPHKPYQVLYLAGHII